MRGFVMISLPLHEIFALFNVTPKNPCKFCIEDGSPPAMFVLENSEAFPLTHLGNFAHIAIVYS